jgi:YegS/Rv2252/BmrU family lipid kinase
VRRPYFDKVVITGNPTSGRRKVRRWFDRVVQEFRDAGYPVDGSVTREAGDSRAAAQALSAPGTLVVAFGGDGTLNEILNGADLDRAMLAVVPAGTGNVMAKELGMARHPIDAVHQILAGRPVQMDIGVCNGRRFVCMFGAGLDGAIVRKIHQARGGGLTQWHYAPFILRVALHESPWHLDVEIDGVRAATGADQVVVSNTCSYGGPIEMTPAASPVDGLMDVVCLRRRGLLHTARLACTMFLKSTHRDSDVGYGRASRVRVAAREEGVAYQIDGEDAGDLPAEIEITPAAATFMVPPLFTPRRAHALPG